MGTRGSFPRGINGRGVNLSTHLHAVPRSRMVELYRDHFIFVNKIFYSFMELGPTMIQKRPSLDSIVAL
jgi:hypothetical protein